MNIQQAMAASTSASSSLAATRRAYPDGAAKSTGSADDIATSISQEGRDRLAAEAAAAAGNDGGQGLRITGPVYSLKELSEQKGSQVVMVKWTDAQIAEARLREQQDQQREQANAAYAWAHRDRPVGQVVADGKLVATVFDRGTFELPRNVANLSSASLDPNQRLAEIAAATHGQIIHSNFLPTSGAWSGPGAPESELPPITARSMMEIFEQEIMPAMEKMRQAQAQG